MQKSFQIVTRMDDIYEEVRNSDDLEEYFDIKKGGEYCLASNIQEDEIRNFNYLLEKNEYYVIFAKIGTWRGNYVGSMKAAYTEVLDKCIGRSVDDIAVFYNAEKGCFEIVAYHHDGTNRFEVYALSKRGESYSDYYFENPKKIARHTLKRVKIA